MMPFTSDIAILAPWLLQQESFKAYASCFAPLLQAGAEFSFYLGQTHLEITLKGQGREFYRLIPEFIPRDALSGYREILNYLPESPGLIKINFSPAAPYQTSLYFPVPLSLKALHHWLKGRGLGNFALPWFTALSCKTGRRVVFPGFDFTSAGTLEPGIFYILARKADIAALSLEPLLEHCGLDCPAALKLHAALLHYASALYLSTNLAPPHSLKCDYENIPAEVALSLLPPAPGLQGILARLGLERLYYLGFRCSPGQPPAYKIYLKRCYSEIDPVQAFADALSATVWL